MKVLISSLLFFLSSAQAQTPSGPAAPDSCPKLYQALHAPAQRLDTIQESYRKLLAGRPILPPRPEVDGQRFVNDVHWQKALTTLPDKPWTFYGQPTWEQWNDTLTYVNSLPKNMPISLETLKNIHKNAVDGFYFRGYEKLRIEEAFKKGSMTREQRNQLFSRIDDGEKLPFSGTDHKDLAGALRTNPLDQFAYTGEYFLPDRTRYMEASTLESFRKNPFFTVDEGTVQKLEDGKVKAVIHFAHPDQVNAFVESSIKKARERLAVARSPEATVRAVIEMQFELLSIHPFLDGNGRTIRFFSDFIFRKYGLPPPLYPNENDYIMTIDELVEHCIQGMEGYVREEARVK